MGTANAKNMLRSFLGHGFQFGYAPVSPCGVDARSTSTHSLNEIMSDCAPTVGTPVWSPVTSMYSVDADNCPEQTVIVLDWDDTLCPTSAMRDLGFTPYGARPVAQPRLREHSHAVVELLLAASKLSDKVVIVTNAQEGWVEATCTAWMPELLPTLKFYEIVSARAQWEPRGFTSPLDWKKMAFSEIITSFYSRAFNETVANVISVGDADYEREALLQVMASRPLSKFGACRAKAVKFDERPSTERLLRQLRLLTLGLGQVVEHDDSLDVQLDSQGFVPKFSKWEERLGCTRSPVSI